MGEGAHHSNHHRQLGISDVIAGAILFVLLAFALKPLLDSAVPGLLKTETLYHIVASGILFLAVWAALGNFLFAPYLSVMAEREQRTVGDEKAAQDKVREARSLQAKIDEQLMAARLEGIRERDKLVDEAKRQVSKLMEGAAAHADEELAKARSQIAGMKARASAEIENEAQKLADLVIARALEPAATPTVH